MVVRPRNRPPLLISVKSLNRLQRHSAAESFMSKKNSNDAIRNRNRDLPACSTLPQPTAPLRDPYPNYDCIKIQFLPHKKQCVSVTTTSRLMPFWEIIAFCCENLTKCSVQYVGMIQSTLMLMRVVLIHTRLFNHIT
jgi:hypothetical protein